MFHWYSRRKIERDPLGRGVGREKKRRIEKIMAKTSQIGKRDNVTDF